MEITKPINYLPNPKIKAKSLKYDEVGIYANLFEIKLTKDIKMYQYPFEVKPEIAKENIPIRQKLFREPQRQIKVDFGFFLIDGDSLYSLKKVDDTKIYETNLRVKKELIDYKITINKCENEIIIKEQDVNKSQLQKHFIELIIKDILLSNPNVERFKDTYIMLDKEEKIDINEHLSIKFYPGYRTSFVETEKGIFLNVVVTHKFIRNESFLDYLKRQFPGFERDKSIQEELNAQLKGCSFKVKYAKRNYQISEILFDRNPINQTFNIDEETLNLVKYYKIKYNVDIKNKDQPLILVRKIGPQGDPLNLYFIPELCLLVGIDDNDVLNNNFMKQISERTKMEPDVKVKRTNNFIDLLRNETEDKETKWSSKKKAEHYGIQINPLNDLFSAYYLPETQLKDGKNKLVNKNNNEISMVKNAINNIKWVLFYEDNYDDNEGYLLKDLNGASGRYHIKLAKPKMVKIQYGSDVNTWIREANKYFGKGNREYDFALFLLAENSYIYPKLKMHSLCTNGYISQVVKVDTLYKKGIMSICSKILLQINAKLGGSMHKLQIEKSLEGKKLMVIGVDSSKHKDKNNYGTGIAMVATINDSLTNFYSDTKIVKTNDMKEQFHFCISKFIEEATKVYEKNNNGQKPDWIIIYRQGVSLQQKDRLKSEIAEIDNTCLIKNIKYYYILVNTKSTFKFFEKDKGKYYNPYSGLLVIDGVTNKNFFEFYIQPQEVTQGSATPTCFHVAYGNLDFPEIIPKFTFDLCHLYSNWQGSVRIPHVIKCAEKLSKMTAKYKLNELNERLRIGQAYL